MGDYRVNRFSALKMWIQIPSLDVSQLLVNLYPNDKMINPGIMALL